MNLYSPCIQIGIQFHSISRDILRWAEYLFLCLCASLSHRLNILLHGMSPFYFHITNLLLHCAVTCLLMYTCECCVFEHGHLAFVTALIFAVHPIHTEAVSNTHTLEILFAF